MGELHWHCPSHPSAAAPDTIELVGQRLGFSSPELMLPLNILCDPSAATQTLPVLLRRSRHRQWGEGRTAGQSPSAPFLPIFRPFSACFPPFPAPCAAAGPPRCCSEQQEIK